MSAQQRLEGPDLEALLAKVRADFGDGAAIVEANRLRRGGVGGFFAKESYEVVVDVPEGATRTPVATPTADARVDADEVEVVDEDDEFVPFTLDELATRIDDPVPDFSSVLAAAVVESMAGAEPAATPRPEPEPDWPAEAAIADVAPVVAAAPRLPRFEAGGLPTPAPVAAPAPAVAPAPAAVARQADLDALARLGLPIQRLGLPAATDEPAAVALVRMLERLPAAPGMPRSAGAIVTVVGDRDRGVELAGICAEQLGVELEVVVASRRRGAEVRNAVEADERRRAWRRRRRPTVVVVDAPFGVAGDPWAAEVLAALEPVVAMGHVDAGRKPEDVRAWAENLGGLDSLAVDGFDTTTTPAAVLDVGLPVALLDGAPATPARWAALLTDRLVAA